MTRLIVGGNVIDTDDLPVDVLIGGLLVTVRAAGGGSRWIGPFVAGFADVQAAAVLLYTPDAGEYVLGALILEATAPDVAALGVGPLEGPWLAAVSPDYSNADSAAGFVDAHHGYYGLAGDGQPITPTSDPVYAGVIESLSAGTHVATAWQASHAYAADTVRPYDIVDSASNALLFNSGAAGISGLVQPDFTEGVGPWPDGDDIVWTNQSALPSVGSITVLLNVTTPVAP